MHIFVAQLIVISTVQFTLSHSCLFFNVLFVNSFYIFVYCLKLFHFVPRTLLLIMRELIQTERDYVNSLEYIIEVSVLRIFKIYTWLMSSSSMRLI